MAPAPTRALLASLLALLAPRVAAQAMPLPTAEQLHYMDSELTMFIHFSVCTFNDACDGGQQNCIGSGASSHAYPAASFAPTALDTDQWAQTAVAMGAKQACLTTHHSGGFALWPTNASAYSIKQSPFNATGRDIVREFVNSMTKYDIEVSGMGRGGWGGHGGRRRDGRAFCCRFRTSHHSHTFSRTPTPHDALTHPHHARTSPRIPTQHNTAMLLHRVEHGML